MINLPPGIELEDPRPIAAGAPYTFFMPFAVELEALQSGDMIKAIFHQTVGDPAYGVERMWVAIETIIDDAVIGTLDSTPAGMDRIRHGDRVRVPLSHAISTGFAAGHDRPAVPDRREYWDRCFVDDCVLAGRSHADYLYREEPDMTRSNDKYPDSGWRIRGTQKAIDADAEAGRKPHYIALGKVLNADDRWLNLIDSPIDTHWRWNEEYKDYAEAF